MPPPIRLYLVRHGQSEANLDKTVNARLPDHRVELSPEGHRQAAAAGEYLAGALPRDARTRILCSPYVRTRQTSAAIEQALTAAGLPFDRREAVELREIAFVVAWYSSVLRYLRVGILSPPCRCRPTLG